MRRDFDKVAAETFDIIVVGGGIIGAGIARDAALRGIRTLLLEKDDFGCGTTSRSSRLIHGGLRYLRRLELGLVRQDLRERDVLLRIAPHLVHNMPFVIPVSRSGYAQRLALPLGLLAYDLLYPKKSLPSHRRLSRRETLDLEPNLQVDGLVGSYLYYDCQAPFVERLCLENVLDAADNSSVVLNHAKVTGFVRSGSAVSGVQVQDMVSGETYEVRARMVVNASGHWVDSVSEMLGGKRKPMLRRTKGIHLLTPSVSQNAVVLFSLSDHRIFFVIPWEGCSLIGTTDTDYQGNLETVEADAEDVEYMLTGVQRVFPAIQSADVHYATAGLRSLAGSGGAKASNVSRNHKIVDHDTTDGIAGLISVLGGKITAYRAVAEQAVDLVCRKLRCREGCVTAEAPLPGAPAVPEQELQKAAEAGGLPVGTVTHLAALYGSRYSQVLELASHDPGAEKIICDHCEDIFAQVRHAVEEEGALTVADFLLRRSAVGLMACQGLDAVGAVASEMGRLLGWSTDEQRAQVEAYQALASARRRYVTGQSN